MSNKELIAKARAEVERAAHGTPETHAAMIRAGEVDDIRLRLLVRLADALAAVSDTTPSEDQIEAAIWALIDWDTDIVDRGVRDEHYRERRAEVERIAPILAAYVPAPTPSEGEREALIHECVQFVDEAAFDAPQDYPLAYETATSTVRSIIETAESRGLRLTPPAPVDREKLIEVLCGHHCDYGDCACGWHSTIGDDSLEAHLAGVLLEAFPALAVFPVPAEVDERIIAWEAVAAHPAIKTCYEEERPLLHAVLDRLSLLAGIEMTVNKLAPAPARDEWEYGLRRRSEAGEPLPWYTHTTSDTLDGVTAWKSEYDEVVRRRKPGEWELLPVTEEER